METSKDQAPSASAPVSLTPLRLSCNFTSVAILITLYAVFALAYTAQAWLRHDNLETNALDLGYEDQVIWNTLHGMPYQFTLLQGGGFTLDYQAPLTNASSSLLGYHAEILLAALTPLYAVLPDVHALLALQALVVCAGALFVFALADKRLDSRWAALLLGATYLSSPFLGAELLSDFHTVALATTLLLALLYAVERRWLVPALALAVLTSLAKEDAPFVVALVGAWTFGVRRQRVTGLTIALIGLLIGSFDFALLIPHFSAGGTSPFVARYGYLGNTPARIILGFVTHPWLTWPVLSDAPARSYLATLLASTGAMPLLAPFTLAIALPSLAINLLSTFPWMQTGMAHYSALVLPVLLVATIEGIASLAHWTPVLLKRIPVRTRLLRYSPDQRALAMFGACWACAFALATNYVTGAGLGGAAFAAQAPSTHDMLLSHFVAELPADGPISVTSSIAPHVTHRARLYLFPNVLDAQAVLVDLTAVPYPTSWGDQRLYLLDLLRNGTFGVVDAGDGYVLLERGAGLPNLPSEALSFTAAAPLESDVESSPGGPFTLVHSEIKPSYTIGAGWSEVVVSDWRLSRTLTGGASLEVFVNSGSPGSPLFSGETPTLVWRPVDTWNVGDVVRVVTPAIAVSQPQTVWLTWVSVSQHKQIWPCAAQEDGQCSSEVRALIPLTDELGAPVAFGPRQWLPGLEVLFQTFSRDI